MKNDDGVASPTDRIREALAWRALSLPDRRPEPKRDFLLLPDDQGVVPVTGSDTTPWERWTLEDTDVTVKQIRALGDLSEGLGSFASLTWSQSALRGTAKAWGPTAQRAVENLVVGVGGLWPEALALAGRGAPSRARGGASPAGGKGQGNELRVRRDSAVVVVRVVGSADPIALRGAVHAVDPRQLIWPFVTAYKADGGRARFAWVDDASGLTRRAGRVGPVDAAASDDVR